MAKAQENDANLYNKLSVKHFSAKCQNRWQNPRRRRPTDVRRDEAVLRARQRIALADRLRGHDVRPRGMDPAVIQRVPAEIAGVFRVSVRNDAFHAVIGLLCVHHATNPRVFREKPFTSREKGYIIPPLKKL